VNEAPSTAALARFLAALEYRSLPAEAVERTKALLVDWVACALAGRDAEPVSLLERFARDMGPADGASEVLGSRTRTSPPFAALVNAAASHVVEQDDLHRASVLHPATVVMPAALATAQSIGASGRALVAACVAGYEAGARVGEALGRSHYRVFHTTGTAGTLAAAAAVAHLLGADARTFNHALGSAGTQAAGLWEFLRDGAHSKQLHTAKAAADGLLAAHLALAGFTGAARIVEGDQGMAAGLSRDADLERLTAGLGQRWAVCETSVKLHASCRHTHPAADALLALRARHRLDHRCIRRITARVYQAALDVLGPVGRPRSVHQAKFSMGFVLALAAREGDAGVERFTEAALADRELLALADRVHMVVDPELDAAYPEHWGARVEVELEDGERLAAAVADARGDPASPLSRADLEDKAHRLAAFGGGATREEMRILVERLWRLEAWPTVDALLPASERARGCARLAPSR